MQKIIHLEVGDTLEMKKPHPCGNSLFKILRVGSDVRIQCSQCGHEVTLDRLKIEKAIKTIIPLRKEENHD